MRPQPHLVAVIVLTCLASALLALAGRAQHPSPDAEQEAPPRAAISGRAVYDDTGRPVRRAQVSFFSGEMSGSGLLALTDADGMFRIEGIPAGRYFLAVEAPGILSPLSLASAEDLRSDFFDIDAIAGHFDAFDFDGKSDKEVVVRARRGAAIGGRVTYSDGEPAVSTTIHIMRRSEGRFVKFLLGVSRGAVASMRTDDRGVYRVAGLPPGEYIVAVSEEADHSGENDQPMDFSGYGLLETIFSRQLLMTFHPSAVSMKEAATLKLGVGEELSGIDITIADRATYVLQGTVRARRGGRPLAGATVTISRKDDDDTTDASGPILSANDSRFRSMTDEQGRWQFRELPEGSYTIYVTPSENYERPAINANMNSIPNSNMTYDGNHNVMVGNVNIGVYRQQQPPRRSLAPARRELKLTGDTADVVIELGSAASISGTVSVEGGDPPQYAGLSLFPSGWSLESYASDGRRPRSTNIHDGAFVFDGLEAGSYYIRPHALLEGRLRLKSITWNGRNLMREPVEIREGGTIEGVRVVYARDVATLTVRAATADGGNPARNVNVFVIPSDAGGAWWALDLSRGFCSTGSTGSCTLTVGPGEYRIVALPARSSARSIEAELKRRMVSAPQVMLSGGEVKTIEVAAPHK